MNRTTFRTIQMLEIISKHKEGLFLKDIVDLMGIPKSSAFDILHTLIDTKMVSVTEDNDKKYVIGVKAFEIGSSFIANNDLVTKAKQELESLAEEMNETVFIGVLDEDKVVYVFKHQPESARITTANVGKRNDLYCTSLGKALLAFIDEDKMLEIVNRIDFVKRAKNTITDKQEFLEDLKRVRERGYAIDDRENEDHMLCLGAPIYNYKGEVIASISISDLYDDKRNIELEGQKIRETAERISQKLGYYKY